MGRELDELLEELYKRTAERACVAAGCRAGVLLLVGDYYALREAQVSGTILVQNPAAESLLHFYRVGMGG